MIIDNFYIKRITVAPFKTNSPLSVDANTMLAFSLAAQPFQMIAGWYA
jgi:hypothetical protein